MEYRLFPILFFLVAQASASFQFCDEGVQPRFRTYKITNEDQHELENLFKDYDSLRATWKKILKTMETDRENRKAKASNPEIWSAIEAYRASERKIIHKAKSLFSAYGFFVTLREVRSKKHFYDIPALALDIGLPYGQKAQNKTQYFFKLIADRYFAQTGQSLSLLLSPTLENTNHARGVFFSSNHQAVLNFREFPLMLQGKTNLVVGKHEITHALLKNSKVQRRGSPVFFLFQALGAESDLKEKQGYHKEIDGEEAYTWSSEAFWAIPDYEVNPEEWKQAIDDSIEMLGEAKDTIEKFLIPNIQKYRAFLKESGNTVFGKLDRISLMDDGSFWLYLNTEEKEAAYHPGWPRLRSLQAELKKVMEKNPGKWAEIIEEIDRHLFLLEVVCKKTTDRIEMAIPLMKPFAEQDQKIARPLAKRLTRMVIKPMKESLFFNLDDED